MSKKIIFTVLLLFIAFCFGIPYLIDNMYLTGMRLQIAKNTTFTSGQILQYYGVILSGLITLTVMYFSLKSQRKIFNDQIARERVNRRMEKRSLPSIDEQSLTGYKLGKYNFTNTPILYINESYKFISDNDFKVSVALNDEKVQVDCLDHLDYRYLVISNTGQYPLFSLNIKIRICINADDDSNRTLQIEQNLNQSTLIAGGSLYVLVGGVLETIKFIDFYNLGEKDNGLGIRVYIPQVEINCTTVTGEKLSIKQVRSTLENDRYITEIKSDITFETIEYSTNTCEIQYIGFSAQKSKEIESLAENYVTKVLLPKYRREKAIM